MIKIPTLFLPVFLLQASLVHSATKVELVNERTVDGDKQTYLVNALYQNENSRYTFHDPDDGEKGAGVYLLSDDGGKTAYYIDSNENSCHHWSNAEFTKTLSGFLLQTKDKFNIEGTNLVIEKQLEEPAETMHGLSNRHFRYVLSFDANYKYGFFKDKYAMERRMEFWVSGGADTIAATLPLFQNVWQYTGNDELDQQIRSVIGADTSFRLRSEIKQSRTDKKGKTSITEIVQYIKTLEQVEDLPDEAFQIPDCDEVGAKKMEKKFKALLKGLLS